MTTQNIQIRGSKCHCLWHLNLVGGCPQGSKWDDSWVGMAGHLCAGPGLPTGQRTDTTNRDRSGFRTFINQAPLLPISCCLKALRKKQSSIDNPPDHLWGLVMDSWGVHQEPPPPVSVLSEPRQVSLSVPGHRAQAQDWGRNQVLVAVLRQASPVPGMGGPLQAPLPRTRSRSPAGQPFVHCQQLWLWFFSMSKGHLEMSVLWHHLKSLIRPAWEELGPRLRLPPAPTGPLPLLCLSSRLWTLTNYSIPLPPLHGIFCLAPDASIISVFQAEPGLPSGGLSTPWHHALGWHSSPLGGRSLDWASGQLGTQRLPSSRGLG